MTDFNAKELMSKIYAAESPSQVDTAFAPLAEMKPAARRKAIDAFEKEFIDTFRAEFLGADVNEMKRAVAARDAVLTGPLADLADMGGLGGLVGEFMQAVGLAEGDDFSDDREVAQDLMTASQVFFNIHKLKGAKADPLVKTFVAEAAKLSDDEYATVSGQTKLLIKLVESDKPAAAPAAAKPRNPFRPS